MKPTLSSVASGIRKQLVKSQVHDIMMDAEILAWLERCNCEKGLCTIGQTLAINVGFKLTCEWLLHLSSME